jgi:UDP-3-O-[3-hydroxymyristoyl] N-acetylglucosamine deacetylase
MTWPRKRRTLRGEVFFEGAGVHSGLKSSVTISPNGDGRGISFLFGDKTYRICDAVADGSRRSTTLTFPGGEVVQTAEHLLAAIVGVGLDDALIKPSGREIPILDGSSGAFADGITACGFEEFDSIFIRPSLAAPVCVDMGASSLTAMPSDELRIAYVVNYPGTAIGTEMKDIVITPETFMSEIAPARTFCLNSEVEEIRRSGLGLGGDVNNVLIIGDDGPAGSAYKIECECAAHKVADLLGDMAIAGFVANAHYLCFCGGHKLHAKLTARLKNCALIHSGR